MVVPRLAVCVWRLARVVFKDTPNKVRVKHNLMCNIGYADGHAAAVKATALKASGKTFGFDTFNEGKFNGE